MEDVENTNEMLNSKSNIYFTLSQTWTHNHLRNSQLAVPKTAVSGFKDSFSHLLLLMLIRKGKKNKKESKREKNTRIAYFPFTWINSP